MLGPFSRRRAAFATAALGLFAVGLILLGHAPFVRRAALIRILPAVEEAFNLRLEASRLDYSLATLRIGLADVALSRPDMASEPFFTADYLSVVLPWRALVGEIAFRDIAVTNAHVIVRRWANGTTNLPESQDTPETLDGEPTPLRIDRLAIPELTVDIRDEQATLVVWVPAAALLLDGDDGYVRLQREAQVSTQSQSTLVSELDGRAAFDGRALRLTGLRINSAEVDAEVDGSVTIIAREQTVDARIRGTADLTQLTRWVIANGDLPRGDVVFDASIAGPFDALKTGAALSSKAIAWRDTVIEDVGARVAVAAQEVQIAEVRLAFAGGRATASGVVPLADEGKGHLTATWYTVDLASAAGALAPDADVLPSGTMSGDLRAEGIGLDASAWSGSVNGIFAAGANARGRIAVGGEAAVRFVNRSWNIEGNHRIADAAPLSLSLRGDENGAIDGTMAVGETDVARLAAALGVTGLASVPSDAISSGRLQASVRVGGSLDDPEIDGGAMLENLEGSQFRAGSVSATITGRPIQPAIELELESPEVVVSDQPLAEVRATGRVRGSTLTLDRLTARQPATTGSLVASGTYQFVDARYSASVTASEWQLMNPAGQPLSGTVALDFSGEGTIEQPGGRGNIVLRQGSWQETSLGDVTATVALDGTTADVDAAAPEFGATAKAKVVLDAPYQTVADARVDRLQLERILEQVELPTPVRGTTTAIVHAEGPLQSWTSGSASVEIAELDATAGDLIVRLREPARLRYADGNAYVDRVEAAAGDLNLSAAGVIPAFKASPGAPGVLVTAVGDVDAVARAAAATGLTELPIRSGEGPVALLARVTGALQAPVVAADLEVGPASIALEDLPSVTELRLRAHAEDGWIELREAAASYEQAAVTATGRAPLALFAAADPTRSGAASGPGGSAELHARATNLTPAVLAAFVEPGTLDELAGSIDATLDASTPTLELADLVGELRIDRFDVRVADIPITQGIPTRIVARDGFARVDAWEWLGQGKSLAVRGQVRLADRQAAILANGVVDLRVLTPFVRGAGLSTTGTLEPRLSITGAIDNPRVDGDIVITDGEMRLADPRLVVSDLTVRTVLSRTTARITQMTGSVNGGALTGDGEIEYDPEQGVAGQITTRISGMNMNFPEGLRSEVDADLALAIQTTPAEGRPATDPGFKGRLSGHGHRSARRVP